MIWRVVEIEESVICRGRLARGEISIILHIIWKPPIMQTSVQIWSTLVVCEVITVGLRQLEAKKLFSVTNNVLQSVACFLSFFKMIY